MYRYHILNCKRNRGSLASALSLTTTPPTVGWSKIWAGGSGLVGKEFLGPALHVVSSSGAPGEPLGSLPAARRWEDEKRWHPTEMEGMRPTQRKKREHQHILFFFLFDKFVVLTEMNVRGKRYSSEEAKPQSSAILISLWKRGKKKKGK